MLGLGLMMVAPSTAHAGLSETCRLPDPLLALSSSLPRTGERIKARAGVNVLAIGSSSTQGVGASSQDTAYPAVLERDLAARFPGIDFNINNKGIGGEVAATTLERLKADVTGLKPDLVIWQLGTNDALASIAPEIFSQTLVAGLSWMKSMGVDIILMDPQFFPRIAENALYADYVARIATIAREQNVAVMRRYDQMRHWSTAQPEVDMLWHDKFHLNDTGYRCVSEALAEAIEASVAPSSPGETPPPAIPPLTSKTTASVPAPALKP